MQHFELRNGNKRLKITLGPIGVVLYIHEWRLNNADLQPWLQSWFWYMRWSRMGWNGKLTRRSEVYKLLREFGVEDPLLFCSARHVVLKRVDEPCS